MPIRRTFRTLAMTAGLLAGTLATAQPPVSAANPCRVFNVTEDTHAGSLIRMAAAAHDGDRLRVWGTCRGEIVIDTDVVIRGMGEGATLTGRGRTRVVRVERGANVVMRNLRVTRGWSADQAGGGIDNAGSVTLEDSLVSRNRADAGAGIWSPGPLTVRRSTVERNVAESWGGGIATAGPSHISDSVIRSNVAGEGGGLHYVAASTEDRVLEGSVVAGNEAAMGGGIATRAFEGSGLRISLIDSIVSENAATGPGGGIWNVDTMDLIGSVVRDNTSGGRGGGLWNGGDLSLSSSSVSGNTADAHGGGLWNDADLTLTGSTVSGNSSGRKGGGIGNEGTATLDDTTISANTASTSGGGVYNLFDPDAETGIVTLQGTSSVTGNTPDDCVGTPAC